MATLKEKRDELKKKEARLEQVLVLDKKFNEGVYKSKGNICPSKKGLSIALEKKSLMFDIEELKKELSIKNRIKAKIKSTQKTSTKTSTKANENILTKTNKKARG